MDISIFILSIVLFSFNFFILFNEQSFNDNREISFKQNVKRWGGIAMSKSVISEGKTTQEAIEKGLKEIKLPREFCKIKY